MNILRKKSVVKTFNKFSKLPLGAITPKGWLLEQLQHYTNYVNVASEAGLYLWEYPTIYVENGVVPSMYNYDENFRKYYEMGVTGYFAEAEGITNADFYEMKNWLMAKLMEDPYLDMDALMNDFIYGYYGEAAGPYVRQYLDYMHERAEANGITTGRTETSFAPIEACTRAQVVTFLWRAAGEPEPQSMENPFPDVADGKYFTKAVLWAAEQGITGGYSDGTFGPDKTCTRDQIVTFLWRYMGKPAPESTEITFPDIEEGKFYTEAVLWAAEEGITGGFKDGTFGPAKKCTRDQIVTFLYRAIVE